MISSPFLTLHPHHPPAPFPCRRPALSCGHEKAAFSQLVSATMLSFPRQFSMECAHFVRAMVPMRDETCPTRVSELLTVSSVFLTWCLPLWGMRDSLACCTIRGGEKREENIWRAQLRLMWVNTAIGATICSNIALSNNSQAEPTGRNSAKRKPQHAKQRDGKRGPTSKYETMPCRLSL